MSLWFACHFFVISVDYLSCCDTVFGTWRRCPGVVVLIQLGSLFNVGSFVSRDFLGTWPFRFSSWMPAPFRTASALQKGQAAVGPHLVHELAFRPSICLCSIFISLVAGFCCAIWFLLRFESGDEL